MAHTATHTSGASVFAGISTLLNRIGDGIMRAAESRSRVDQMDRLSAKTDAELAEMGLRREDIARYVFRDLMFI